MKKKSKPVVVVVAAVAVGAGALLSWSGGPRDAEEPIVHAGTAIARSGSAAAAARGDASTSVTGRERAEAPVFAAREAQRPGVPPGSAAVPDERSLMKVLHAMGETAPAVSLQLARDGNDRFGESGGAAERGWVVVKSLTDLGRFDEAQAEARRVVEKYPGTPWAADVERHLLVNPLYPADD